jgi:hypothetical protein
MGIVKFMVFIYARLDVLNDYSSKYCRSPSFLSFINVLSIF